jgi:hypothetical protein
MSPLKGSRSPHSTSLANLNTHSRPNSAMPRTYHLFFIGNHSNLTLPRPLLAELDGWYPQAPLLLSVRNHMLSIRLASSPEDANSYVRVFGNGFIAEIPEDVLTHLGWRQVEEITIRLDPQGGGLRANLVRQRGRRYEVTITRDELLELLMAHPKIPPVLRDQHITTSSIFNGRVWDLVLPEVSFTFEVEHSEATQSTQLKKTGPPDTKHLHMSDPEYGITIPGYELEVNLEKLEQDQQIIRESKLDECATCPEFLHCAISRYCLQQRERERQAYYVKEKEDLDVEPTS